MKNSSPIQLLLLASTCLVLGVGIGGYLFRDVQPRSVLALDHCENCLSSYDLAGLLGAVLVQRTGYVPHVILETDKTIAIEHPIPATPIHYVIIPKKDIKDAGVISAEDTDYLIDAYAVMGELVKSQGLQRYRIFTNGPSFQHVTYLHFHLQGRE